MCEVQEVKEGKPPGNRKRLLNPTDVCIWSWCRRTMTESPVANAYTNTHRGKKQQKQNITRTCSHIHTHTHTVAQWGEGFNKPTVTWIYGGVSGLSQETRWTERPRGSERNRVGGVRKGRGEGEGRWSHRHINVSHCPYFSLSLLSLTKAGEQWRVCQREGGKTRKEKKRNAQSP